MRSPLSLLISRLNSPISLSFPTEEMLQFLKHPGHGFLLKSLQYAQFWGEWKDHLPPPCWQCFFQLRIPLAAFVEGHVAALSWAPWVFSVKLLHLHFMSLVTILQAKLFSKTLVHVTVCSSSPHFINLMIRILYGRVSKALLKSRHCPLLSPHQTRPVISSQKFNHAFPSVKPLRVTFLPSLSLEMVYGVWCLPYWDWKWGWLTGVPWVLLLVQKNSCK